MSDLVNRRDVNELLTESEWREWLVANYDPTKPVSIALPFRQGRWQADLELEAALQLFGLIKRENNDGIN